MMRRRARTPVMKDGSAEEIRAHGRLPHADIDIVYRRARENDAEFIGINVQTIPMSQTFERLLAMSNPFYFWTQVAEAAWRPWLQGLHAISSQATPKHLRPPADD
jgi:hypothetical protein